MIRKEVKGFTMCRPYAGKQSSLPLQFHVSDFYYLIKHRLLVHHSEWNAVSTMGYAELALTPMIRSALPARSSEVPSDPY